MSPRATDAPEAGDGRQLDQSCMRHSLGYQLAQANIPVRKVFLRNIGEPLQLSTVEFTVLSLVANNADVTQKQLSQALAVSAPNITMLLDRLEQRQLLTRERSVVDRRAQHIRLTRKGTALADKAMRTSLTMEQDVLRHLTEGERAILIELLQKVARHRRV